LCCAVLVAVAFTCVAVAPASAADAGWHWVSVGPSVITGPYGEASGRVSSLAISPQGVLYAATANGGIWRRTATGWEPLTDALPNLAFGVVAIAPSDPKILYAVTGEAHDCSLDCGFGSGVTRSTNGGTTWTPPSLNVTAETADVVAQRDNKQCNPPQRARGSAIVIDPQDPTHVVVGTDQGVFVSVDGGGSWTRSWCYPVTDIKIHAGMTDLLMADRYGLHTSVSAKTADAGLKWENVAVDPQQLPRQTDADEYSIALAVAPSQPAIVYASVARASYGGGIGCLAGLLVSRAADTLDFKRIDVQDYFSSSVAYGSGTDCQGTYDNTVAVDPANPNRIFVGGIALFSIDAVAPAPIVVNYLDNAHPQLHPDQHALLFAGGSLYIGNDGGVSELTPDGKLLNRNSGLRITQFSRGGSQQGDGDHLVAGTQDNGTIDVTGLRSKHPEQDADAAWCAISGADGGMTTLMPGPRGLYVESQQGAIRRARTLHPPCIVAGSPPPYPDPNWSEIPPPFALTPEKAPWITPFAVVRADPSTMIAGGDNVFRAVDVPVDSKAWEPLSNFSWTPFAPSPRLPLLISAVAVGDDAGQVIYAGHSANGVLQYTFTGGGAAGSWRLEDPIADSRPGVADDGTRGDVTDIVVAPDSAYHVFVAIKFDRKSYVLETPDTRKKPASFTDLGAGLSSGVNRVLLLGGKVLAATDDGVYRHDGPAQWTRLGSSELPHVPVVDLVPTESGCVFALTHGRGAWYACPAPGGT
jgi:hypothetical protein